MSQLASRRSFMAMVSSGVVCSVAVPLGGFEVTCAETPSDPRLARLAHALKALIKAPRELDVLGEDYLKSYEIRPSAEQILRELCCGSLETWVSLEPVALKQALRAAIDADFRAGRLTSVAGWLISHSEARICALARLVS